MIDSREQRRRKAALLHRRKIAIVASILLVAVLSGVLAFVSIYFANVIPYTEVYYEYDKETGEKIEYKHKYFIKKVDGIFKMYDDNDKLLETQIPPHTSEELYVTRLGTMIYVNPNTGEYERRVIPEILFDSGDARGETLEGEQYLSIFKGMDKSEIVSIDISNDYGEYTICRIDIDKDGTIILGGKTGDFVLRNAALSATNLDFISYLTYFAAHPLVKQRITDPIKDADGKYTEYGLSPETRVDAEGNEYQYTPKYYVLTTTDGTVHKIIIGDSLVDRSGYYIQYQSGIDGELRDTVYVMTPTDMTEFNGTNFENTILGPSKNFLTPAIIYPATTKDYFDVTDFSVKKRTDGELDEIINFSFDSSDRTGTVKGIHPYVFSDDSFKSYHPNYDNIDETLMGLMEPDIVDIAVVNPTKAQRAEYGLMRQITKEDGSIDYEYFSEYTVSFRRTAKITNDTTGKEEKLDIIQTIYISKPNANGNYYTFTEMRSPSVTSESTFKGLKIDMICEVSYTTLNFLSYDTDDWVYPAFMEIGLDFVDNIELIWKDKQANIKVNNSMLGDLSVLDFTVTDSKTYTNASPLKTFGALTITEASGKVWTITPREIFVYSASGTELKPQTKKSVKNELGQDVQILQKPIEAANGDWYYINKDDITIVRTNGSSEKILRHHSMLFQRTFAGIISTRIVDSYKLTDAEEQALRADSSALILTINIKDTDGKTTTYEFYSLPESARKVYIFVDGVGGFYVQKTKIDKIYNDMEKAIAGLPVVIDDIK